MITRQKALLLPRKPLLKFNVRALRADAMLTGVVPGSAKMPFGADLHVATKLCGAALQNGLGRMANVGRKRPGPLQITISILHDLLYGQCTLH